VGGPWTRTIFGDEQKHPHLYQESDSSVYFVDLCDCLTCRISINNLWQFYFCFMSAAIICQYFAVHVSRLNFGRVLSVVQN
jgi:hypothetical protein